MKRDIWTLREFLNNKGVLAQFDLNTVKELEVKGYRKGITLNRISSFFLWHETPEGREFWFGLHEEFENSLNNN